LGIIFRRQQWQVGRALPLLVGILRIKILCQDDKQLIRGIRGNLSIGSGLKVNQIG